MWCFCVINMTKYQQRFIKKKPSQWSYSQVPLLSQKCFLFNNQFKHHWIWHGKMNHHGNDDVTGEKNLLLTSTRQENWYQSLTQLSPRGTEIFQLYMWTFWIKLHRTKINVHCLTWKKEDWHLLWKSSKFIANGLGWFAHSSNRTLLSWQWKIFSMILFISAVK